MVARAIFRLTILASLLSVTFSARIIFLFAGGNMSHKLGIWPFVLALANRGHHITFVSSYAKPMPSHPNVTDFAPEVMRTATATAYNIDRFRDRETGEDSMGRYSDLSIRMCRSMLNTKNDSQLTNIIENGDYDLAIVNSVLGECGILIASYHGWKFIEYSSSTILGFHHHIFGAPWEGSYIPTMYWKPNYPMGLFDRVQNVITYWRYANRDGLGFGTGLEELMKERFGLENVPPFVEMGRNASLLFYNAHHAIDFARSLPPMFIPVGGMQCWDKVGVLPKNFQEFMDNAEEGVILIAFGSTIEFNTLSPKYLYLFFNMMKKFSKVRFIWRWKGTMPEDSPSNLMASEWLPQKEILNHPNVIAMMTHCGMNSVTEATCFGLPIIGVPLFADQDYVAYRLEVQELGVVLEVKGITQERMNDAVEKILSTTKYKSNMVTRSRILQDQPQNPIDTAVYWTEFVLRHDDMSSFKPMDLDQPQFIRLMLDAYFAILCMIVLLPLLIMYAVVRIVKTLNHRK